MKSRGLEGQAGHVLARSIRSEQLLKDAALDVLPVTLAPDAPGLIDDNRVCVIAARTMPAIRAPLQNHTLDAGYVVMHKRRSSTD